MIFLNGCVMDKFTNIVLAGALGDALGYKVEFFDIDRIKSVYGPKGITFGHYADNYICSDDTQMTLFLLERINKMDVFRLEEFQELCQDAFYDWFKTQNKKRLPENFDALNSENYEGSYFQQIKKKLEKKTVINDDLSRPDFTLLTYEPMWMQCAPGMTCLKALSSGVRGIVSKPINDSMGCGTIMRVAPLLKIVEKFNISDLQLLNASHIQSAITHGNREGWVATGIYILLLKYLTQGLSAAEALSKAYTFVMDKENDTFNVLRAVDKSFENYIFHLQELISRDKVLTPEEIAYEYNCGEGWVSTSCLGLAFYAFSKAKSFDECVEMATNHSGDSDSTATLAAQMYAAANNVNFEYYPQTNLSDVILKICAN